MDSFTSLPGSWDCLRHCTCDFGGDWFSNVQKWLEFLNHLLFVEWMSCLKACTWCSAAISQKVMLPQRHLERIGGLLFCACLKPRFLSSSRKKRRKRKHDQLCRMADMKALIYQYTSQNKTYSSAGIAGLPSILVAHESCQQDLSLLLGWRASILEGLLWYASGRYCPYSQRWVPLANPGIHTLPGCTRCACGAFSCLPRWNRIYSLYKCSCISCNAAAIFQAGCVSEKRITQSFLCSFLQASCEAWGWKWWDQGKSQGAVPRSVMKSLKRTLDLSFDSPLGQVQLKTCPKNHQLQLRQLASGQCDWCFCNLKLGHGCMECDFDLCNACMGLDVDPHERVLDILSLKTCAKIVEATDIGKPERIGQVIEELTRTRVKQLLGAVLNGLSCRKRGSASSVSHVWMNICSKVPTWCEPWFVLPQNQIYHVQNFALGWVRHMASWLTDWWTFARWGTLVILESYCFSMLFLWRFDLIWLLCSSTSTKPSWALPPQHCVSVPTCTNHLPTWPLNFAGICAMKAVQSGKADLRQMQRGHLLCPGLPWHSTALDTNSFPVNWEAHLFRCRNEWRWCAEASERVAWIAARSARALRWPA